ncbi:hypothetical protein AB1Y20_006781 [Prymnesium parvum]|uniref:Rho-GAP domain-containing protein n=1 Tax=Prymnesium parvum TaxID=97485 RepID=A0AB34J0N5_PRYPA
MRKWRVLSLAHKVRARRAGAAGTPLFGSSLADVGKQRALRFVQSCFLAVEDELAGEPWLFRMSVAAQRVDEAIRRAEDDGVVRLSPSDPPELAICVLKAWLRAMPEPLLPRDIYTPGDSCAAVLGRLPPLSREVLKAVLQLARASLDRTAHLEQKLSVDGMARLLAPALLHPFVGLQPSHGTMAMRSMQTLLEDDAALVRTLLAGNTESALASPTSALSATRLVSPQWRGGEAAPAGGEARHPLVEHAERSQIWLRSELASLEHAVEALKRDVDEEGRGESPRAAHIYEQASKLREKLYAVMSARGDAAQPGGSPVGEGSLAWMILRVDNLLGGISHRSGSSETSSLYSVPVSAAAGTGAASSTARRRSLPHSASCGAGALGGAPSAMRRDESPLAARLPSSGKKVEAKEKHAEVQWDKPLDTPKSLPSAVPTEKAGQGRQATPAARQTEARAAPQKDTAQKERREKKLWVEPPVTSESNEAFEDFSQDYSQMKAVPLLNKARQSLLVRAMPLLKRSAPEVEDADDVPGLLRRAAGDGLLLGSEEVVEEVQAALNAWDASAGNSNLVSLANAQNMTTEQKLLVAHACVEIRLARLAWKNKLKELQQEREDLAEEMQQFAAELARWSRKNKGESAREVKVSGAEVMVNDPERHTDVVRSAIAREKSTPQLMLLSDAEKVKSPARQAKSVMSYAEEDAAAKAELRRPRQRERWVAEELEEGEVRPAEGANQEKARVGPLGAERVEGGGGGGARRGRVIPEPAVQERVVQESSDDEKDRLAASRGAGNHEDGEFRATRTEWSEGKSGRSRRGHGVWGSYMSDNTLHTGKFMSVSQVAYVLRQSGGQPTAATEMAASAHARNVVGQLSKSWRAQYFDSEGPVGFREPPSVGLRSAFPHALPPRAAAGTALSRRYEGSAQAAAGAGLRLPPKSVIAQPPFQKHGWDESSLLLSHAGRNRSVLYR